MALHSLAASFLAGLLATMSPCVLPLYPGFLAFLAGQSDRERRMSGFVGCLVLLGMLSAMLLLGLAIALLQVAIGRALSLITPLAYGVILVLGVLMLLGVNPFPHIPQPHVPGARHPVIQAYLYGFLYGPVVLPCSGPFVVGIFLYSLTVTDYVVQALLFLAFGLGLGLPLLVLALLAQARRGWLARALASRHALASRVGGLLLIILALWGLWDSWEFVKLYLT
jgi:cytochrome c-type biogenesis protein